MKKLPLVLLSIMTMTSHAQSLLGSLGQHQETLSTPGASESSSTTPDVASSSETVSSSSKRCEENDQTSLPLAYVTSLIQQKDGKLNIIHNPRTGELKVSSPGMIGNCSSMLEWTLKKPSIQGQKAYALEVKIKQGENCSASGCSYKVAKVENGEFKKHEEHVFEPTLKGFEECLKTSGVIANGKVEPKAIYTTPVSEKFSGLEESGKLLFLSRGPSTPLVRAKYGDFEFIDGCDYYESAHPEIKSLLTLEDAEKARLDAEAAKLRECKVDEYEKLADFIEKYEGYASELGEVRDRLILEAAKKAAKAIEEGKYTDEDLRVISDFHKYVVQPKADLASALYEQMLELEGDARKEVENRLIAVRDELKALNQKPYFLASHTLKLIEDGKFTEAEKLNDTKLVLQHYKDTGKKIANVVITPDEAASRVEAGKVAFADTVVKETEKYEYRTGQASGNHAYYSGLASRMRQNIQVRTENFNEEIRLEIQRMRQPNGYCYRYWRNTQKCIQDSMERIKELQALLQHYNNIDQERAAEYDAKAIYYGDLEAQGRRYVAAQNGEPVPEETPVVASTPTETTTPPTRTATDPGVYSFDFNQPGQGNPQMYQQHARMMPEQFQQPMTPYANNHMFMQQNPFGSPQQSFLGMHSYPYNNQFGMLPQGAYNFGWNGGMQYGQQDMYQQGMNPFMQQPQMGFWNSPQRANQYSIYGRLW